MFFLMLLAGVRMEPLDFARTSKLAILVAVGGMVVPIAAGILLGLIVLPESPLKLVQCLLLGTALAITAVPVAVRIFMDIGQLETRVGKTVVAAALWDDLISLFLLAIVIAAMGEGAGSEFYLYSIFPLIAKVVFFFAVTIPAGLFLFARIAGYFRYLRFPEVDFSMMLMAALAYAIFAERMDMHFIIGAFLAGMFFHPNVVDRHVYERVENQMSGITQGFFAPIFFVSVGMQLDFSAVTATPVFVTVFVLIALCSKIVGAGLPAYWVGHSRHEALMVGVGMSGRGAVELIVAGMALQAGGLPAAGSATTDCSRPLFFNRHHGAGYYHSDTRHPEIPGITPALSAGAMSEHSKATWSMRSADRDLPGSIESSMTRCTTG
ncbi:MAG: cation:proton antiporter [Gammaproteobacteria bacterium]|nr:cation:proton antiporter [Gammaproteobacteria bacterium]MDH5303301.1 cation:proton antiporter [Gammaproteobacteria bacterium]MDH5321616.1 cation:proton antiporter [Gammaproteobacteria bacterium]